jgi:hypothetical protein
VLPDGRLEIVDGHLRAETAPEQMVPVLVLDLDEEESDKLLLTLDPLAAMKVQYRLYDSHIEQICQRAPPSAVLPLEGP